MPEQPRSARETLAEEAGRRINSPECPFCGTDDWTLGDDISIIYYAGDAFLNGPLGKGVGVLAFACGGCGFVRFHSEEALRRLMTQD